MMKMKIEHFIFGSKGETPSTPTLSIAVHLHLFYLNLVPEFAKALSNIPVPFALFVSVPEAIKTDEKDLEESLHRISKLQRLEIRRTPNKGRDLAPMLCTFADELQQYDLILHLHSKKSPHEPLLKDWLPFILFHLLPTSPRINDIFYELEHGTGMVAPPDFLYYTPTGWGSKKNMILAQQLIDRSGLNIHLKEEYPHILFPQGSMFWARTEFLKELFALGLTYDDFPEEPIAPDGTIAHAMERLFFLWGSKSGLSAKNVYESELDILQTQRFIAMAIECSYFIKKNKKHLVICRILIALSVILLLALVYSLIAI